MSAYILETKRINALAVSIMVHINKKQDAVWVCGIEGLLFLIKNKDGDSFLRELIKLNTDAVNYRYNDKQKPDYKKINDNIVPLNLYQTFCLMREYMYQCSEFSEGDEPQAYKEMEKIKYAFAYHIACDATDEKVINGWGKIAS